MLRNLYDQYKCQWGGTLAHILNESDKNLLIFNHLTHTNTPAINVQPDITEVECIRDFRQPCATQRRLFTILFSHISSAANTTAVLTYDDMVDWEASANRLPSRHISVENHAALNQTIDDLLDL